MIMFGKYKQGDVVLYQERGGITSIMEIWGSDFIRCTGDILPHRYYSGRLVTLDGNPEDERLVPCPDRITNLFNVRGKSLRTLNSREVYLDSLLGEHKKESHVGGAGC